MAKGEFIILHMSDLHFTGNTSQYVLESICTSSQLPKTLDFVAITGDFVEERNPKNYKDALGFLSGIIDHFSLPKSRVLLVPGNRDVELPWFKEPKEFKPPEWPDYGDFVSEWYGDEAEEDGRLKENPDVIKVFLNDKDDNPCSPSAYIIDQREHYDCVFLLFNSLAGTDENVAKGISKEKLNIGYIGRKQREAFEEAFRKNGITRELPKVVLLHHHLFPVMPKPTAKEDILREILLIDSPAFIAWLSEQSCSCVLHGHRHRPVFFVHKSRGIENEEDLPRVFETLKVNPYCKNIDITIAGIGSLTQTLEIEKGTLWQSLQVVRLNNNATQYIDTKTTILPFFFIGEKWQNRDNRSFNETRLVSSHTMPDFLKDIYRAESFLTTDLFIHSIYPLARVEKDILKRLFEFFWSPLARAKIREESKNDYEPPKLWQLVDKEDLDRSTPVERSTEFQDDSPEQPENSREMVLQRLVREINEENRKHSIFSIMPFQLEGIYTYTSLFFSEEDIERWAKKEFRRSEWRFLLEPDEVGTVPPRFRNHIDSANREFGEYVPRRVIRKQNSKVNVPRILEIGFGALRTIQYLIGSIRNYNRKTFDDPWPDDFHCEYLGYDINVELKIAAEEIIGGADSKHGLTAMLLSRLKPFPSMSQKEMLQCESAYKALCSGMLKMYVNSVDCFLAAYCLHHTSNNRRILKSLFDGSFFEIIGREHFHIRNPSNVYDAIEKGMLFGDIDDNDRPKLVEALKELYFDYVEYRNKEGLAKQGIIDHPGYLEQVQKIGGIFPNKQREILENVSFLLKDFGVVCIADPNGFSASFNRYRIIDDWPLAIAHFSDWHSVVKDLFLLGFDDFKVYRQIRLKSIEVRNIRVPDHYINSVKHAEPSLDSSFFLDINTMLTEDRSNRKRLDPREIEDQHLGYIVMAQKMPKETQT